MKWIKFGYTWGNVQTPSDKLFETECRERYGKTIAEVREKISKIDKKIMVGIETIVQRIAYLDPGTYQPDYMLDADQYDSEMDRWEKGLLKKTGDRSTRSCIKLYVLFSKMENFINEHPEAKKWCKYNNANSFTAKNLNRPGTIIELENGTKYLIGNINKNAGICDDCAAFSDDAVIKRYAVICPDPKRGKK